MGESGDAEVPPPDEGQPSQAGPETPGHPIKEPFPIKDWINLALNAVIATCTLAGFFLLLQQVKQGEKAENESKEALRASLEQARRTADAAQRSADVAESALRTDQRAWVGVVNFHTPSIQAGAKTEFRLDIKNSGRSPALGVRLDQAYRLQGAKEPFEPTFKNKPPEPLSQVVLQPNMTMGIGVPMDSPLSPRDLDAIRSGKKRLYVYGRIDYKDIFDADHYSTFCLFIMADLSGGNACPTYSEAN